MDSPGAVTFVVVIDVPEQGRAEFLRYERAVLPLLARHGGRLERRLRASDGLTEVHIVTFESTAGFDSYLVDPDREVHRGQLGGVEIRQRLLQVVDVD